MSYETALPLSDEKLDLLMTLAEMIAKDSGQAPSSTRCSLPGCATSMKWERCVP